MAGQREALGFPQRLKGILLAGLRAAGGMVATVFKVLTQ